MYIQKFSEVLKELDMNLSKVKNDYGREIAIVVRSVENLDRMLGLFDLSDETNLKNGEALAGVVSDHINARANMQQPGSPMVDYELTMIQSWINYIFDELERQNKLSMLPHQVVTNRAETKKIIAEQRVEYKKQTEELRKQEEAMKIKQEELDAEESTKITEESTINEQPIINQEELSEGEGLDVKDL